jgi:hypothetical protein
MIGIGNKLIGYFESMFDLHAIYFVISIVGRIIAGSIIKLLSIIVDRGLATK